MASDDGADLLVPDDAVVLTEEEYQQQLADAAAARAAAREAGMAEEAVKKREAYDALIAAGIPEDIATRLSGYYPEVAA
jgi:hypothetical protein